MDKNNLAQVGRALKQLGIQHIPAWLRPPRYALPEARGRSERAFRTHQGRLPQELARAGITNMADANRYLEQVYLPQIVKLRGAALLRRPARTPGYASSFLTATNCPAWLRSKAEPLGASKNAVMPGS